MNLGPLLRVADKLVKALERLADAHERANELKAEELEREKKPK